MDHYSKISAVFYTFYSSSKTEFLLKKIPKIRRPHFFNLCTSHLEINLCKNFAYTDNNPLDATHPLTKKFTPLGSCNLKEVKD